MRVACFFIFSSAFSVHSSVELAVRSGRLCTVLIAELAAQLFMEQLSFRDTSAPVQSFTASVLLEVLFDSIFSVWVPTIVVFRPTLHDFS